MSVSALDPGLTQTADYRTGFKVSHQGNWRKDSATVWVIISQNPSTNMSCHCYRSYEWVTPRDSKSEQRLTGVVEEIVKVKKKKKKKNMVWTIFHYPQCILVTSLEAVCQITHSFLWSHKRLYTGVFTLCPPRPVNTLWNWWSYPLSASTLANVLFPKYLPGAL